MYAVEGASGQGGVEMIGVLGFDEKFLARCLMRAYARGGLARLTVIVPRPAGDAAQRVARARESLETIARDYAGVEARFVEVERGSFAAAFHEARTAISEAFSMKRRVLLCLSGGMRYALLALLLAALTTPSTIAEAGGWVEVDLETGEGHFTIPLQGLTLLPRLDESELRVLEALWRLGEASLPALAAEADVAKSTAWKVLQKLINAGLVERLGRGRYRPTFPPDKPS